MEHQYGTIYQKPDGRWIGQLKAKIHPSRRAKVYDSPEEAAAGLTFEAQRVLLGLSLDTTTDGRVQDHMELWLASTRMKETTRAGHRNQLIRYVKDKPFGLMKLSMVRPLHINLVMAQTPENHTRVFVANLLSRFCTYAVDNGFVLGNPFARSDGPAMRDYVQKTYVRSEKADRSWSLDQLWHFFHAERDPIYRDLWLMTLLCGSRKGEVTGLTWPLVYLDQLYCDIVVNVTTGGGKVVIEKLPKSWLGRKGYLGPFGAKVLAERKLEQASYREGFSKWDDREWVFDRRIWKPAHDRRPGEHLDPANIGRRFHATSDRAGLPRLTGPHGMRRTFVKLAEDKGFSAKVIKVLLGHALTVTEKYAVPTEEELRAAALWLDTTIANRLA